MGVVWNEGEEDKVFPRLCELNWFEAASCGGLRLWARGDQDEWIGTYRDTAITGSANGDVDRI